MSNPQRRIGVSDWLEPHRTAADFIVWPNTGRDATPVTAELVGRLSLAIYVGASTIQLRPTIAEATALIEALEWALAHSEVPA